MRSDPDAILGDRMNRFLKTLLLWLLVAVLPLHAVGAAMPMSCPPLHQQAMSAALQEGAHDESSQHCQDRQAEEGHHAGMAMDGQHHDAAQLADANLDSGMIDDSSSSSVVSSHAGCSACVAGCIGAAAPPSLWNSTPAFSGSEAVTVSPSTLVAGHTPGGLDRPPRHLPA